MFKKSKDSDEDRRELEEVHGRLDNVEKRVTILEKQRQVLLLRQKNARRRVQHD